MEFMMDKPKKVNITRRLILSFGVLISIFLIFGLFTLYDIYRVSSLTRTIYNHPLVVSNAALQTNVSIAKMHRSMKDVVLFNSLLKIKQSIEAVNEEEKQAIRHLDIVKNKILGEEGKTLENEARNLFDEWRPIRKEVIGLVRTDQRGEAAIITIVKGANHVALLEKKMFGLTKYARNKATDFTHEAEKVNSRLNVILITFLLLGVLTSFLVAFFTIKRTTLAEGALRESEEKYRTLINSATEAIIVAQDGIFKFVNPKGEELYGRSQEELASKTLDQFIHAEDQEMVRDRHERRLKGEKLPTTYPFRIITKAGETTWVDLNVTPFSWDNRPATLCFMTNINDKKQAENALKESEDKYRSIIESVEEGYYEIDFQGNFVFLNESLERIFGRPESELIGRFIGDFTDKANRKIGIDAFAEVYETGNPRKGFEWEISHKDGGKKYVSASVSLMADSKGNKKGLRGIIRDETHRKKAEEKLKTYTEKLRTTNIELDEAIQVAENATKAKSEFLANMSHELRTPLNAIIGFSEQMTEPDFDLEKLGEYTKIIENSGKHQLRVVNEILDISKIEAGKLELEKIPFNLDSILKDVQSTGRMILKSRNKSDVVFNVNYQDSISDYIIGDPTKFRQVLLNFLGNATRFTKKGSINIDVRLRDEKTLECYVEDTGIGIPKDKLDTIFEPFQQVDASTTRKYGGTGLGLDLNKKLIKLWGGEIWVDSIQGKGSKFTFTMPYISAAKPKGEKKSGESYKIDPKKDYKILIAEDNPVNLKLAIMYLKSYGLRNIINASNGVEAVSAFKEHKPDLVLMDVHMPVLDGLSATKEIREYEKNSGITKASIIALTASAMAGDREKCLNAGCNDYATKPIIKVELEKKIARNLK